MLVLIVLVCYALLCAMYVFVHDYVYSLFIIHCLNSMYLSTTRVGHHHLELHRMQIQIGSRVHSDRWR